MPPCPALLLFAADQWGRWCATSAASLPAHRSFDLSPFVSYNSRCVGSSGSWVALSVAPYLERRAVIVLLNPVTASEVVLPPLIYDAVWVVSKVVFTPSPAKDDFAAAAICDSDRIAYVTAGARRWAVLAPVELAAGDHLTDLVYHAEGKVYCLTSRGDVHVLRLPELGRQQPARANGPELSLLRTTERISRYPPPVLEIERIVLLQNMSDLFMRHSAESREHDLNPPATVEPLLSQGNLPFNSHTAFAPPYDAVSSVTGTKNLVLCEDNLYLVWRNTSCTVSLRLPGGRQCRVLENEIFVLRYYPQRQPCWDVVEDLGGCSFFVGRNNAMSVYAQGVPRIRANCVYWVVGHGKDQGMVFDMETGRSTPCGPLVGAVPGHPHSTICWYFMSHRVTTTSSSNRRSNSLSIQQ